MCVCSGWGRGGQKELELEIYQNVSNLSRLTNTSKGVLCRKFVTLKTLVNVESEFVVANCKFTTYARGRLKPTVPLLAVISVIFTQTGFDPSVTKTDAASLRCSASAKLLSVLLKEEESNATLTVSAICSCSSGVSIPLRRCPVPVPQTIVKHTTTTISDNSHKFVIFTDTLSKKSGGEQTRWFLTAISRSKSNTLQMFF